MNQSRRSNLPLMLDGATNPFTPSSRVRRALENDNQLHQPVARLHVLLQSRIAHHHNVPVGSVVLGKDIGKLIDQVVSSLALLPRSSFRHPVCRPESRSVVRVASPDLAIGRAIGHWEGVRLARSSQALVVDERFAPFSNQSLLSLYREFDNVVLLRSMETWAGLVDHPVSYAIVPRSMAATIAEGVRPQALPAPNLVAALATFEDWRYVEASIERVRKERLHLFRQLRKLNMVRPLPSVACFVSAEVTRGERDSLLAFLEATSITVHVPDHCSTNRLIRIAAISNDATSTLIGAMIDWSKTL
ncbi:hypothetical protein BH23CHL5_BH23CHL5_08590 [soil metagenome]